jgi:aryl-alcohol dehydrogenase-like predicted oxidoreductase
MQLQQLGRSGLLVSPICLGTMTFGRPVAEADAIKLTHGALDLGINFVDTANVYEGYDRVLGSAGGVAEEIVGKALAGRRDNVILATKVCAPLGPGPQDRGLSATHILRALERSLQKLNTDVIDLYIMHWPDKHVPLEVSLDAMDQAVRQGKARYIGASNHNAALLCEMLWIAEKAGLAPVVSSQIPLSILQRAFHNDLPFCAEKDICVTPYQPLQGGLLTGKYRRGEEPPADSRGSEKPEWLWDRSDQLMDQLEGLEAIAAGAEISMASLALSWTLAQTAVGSLVVGATKLSQVEEAVAAASLQLSCEQLDQIDAICPPPWIQPDPIRG